MLGAIDIEPVAIEFNDVRGIDRVSVISLEASVATGDRGDGGPIDESRGIFEQGESDSRRARLDRYLCWTGICVGAMALGVTDRSRTPVI